MKGALTIGLLAGSTVLALVLAAPARAQPKANRMAQDEDPRAGFLREPAGPVKVPGVRTTFIRVSNSVPGVLYEPEQIGPKAQIAVFVMHTGNDFLTHTACTELSKRGYRVLCQNNSNGKSGTFDDGRFDDVLLEAKMGVQFLRTLGGVMKVVLWGHSGGGTLMTAYQMIAESGVSGCRGAQKIHQCPDTLAGLPPADGVILGDTNMGLGEITLLSVDPAVIDQSSGIRLDPALDMYNPANGFDPKGSHYSEAFKKAFFAAQAAKNNAIIKLAQDRLALIEAGKGQFRDDEIFVYPGGYIGANKLFTSDIGLMADTKRAWPIIHPDGSITTQIIHSVRVPAATPSPSPYLFRGAIKTTVKGFLQTYAIRADADFGYDRDSIHGVQWTSSYVSPPGNVEGFSAPLLTIGMTGGREGWAAELVHDHARSRDNTLVFIEGATHGYTPCKPCETSPGQYGDTIKTTYDYADRWLSKPGRFM